MDLDKLYVIHLPKNEGSKDFAQWAALIQKQHSQSFFTETCQRYLWVIHSNSPIIESELPVEILSKNDAYQFLLELTTGLKSEIAGETDIFGQYKKSWGEYESQYEPEKALRTLMQKLFADTKEIRSRYIQRIGGSSYGTLARMALQIQPADSCLLLGAGKLAHSVSPFLNGKELYVWNRNSERLQKLITHLHSHPRFETKITEVPTNDLPELIKRVNKIVICIPTSENDSKWIQLVNKENPNASLLHLGCLRNESEIWKKIKNFQCLTDLFDLEKSQTKKRWFQIERARTACRARSWHRSFRAPKRMNSEDTHVLTLGTRKSKLAWAQSTWVAQEIEKKNPQVKVELHGIVTRGDQILDRPLSQIDGKEFFVKEVDDALLSKKVDLTVHSLKDLSTERPQGIVTGAYPEREAPHDVIIFHERVLHRLKKKLPIRIGTSSPRRLQNIPSFLEKALPQYESAPVLEFKSIRGNVNTRIQKIHTPSEELDGVVLAMAGLNRLYQDLEGKKVLDSLLKQTLFMIIPLSLNPTAPGQGILCVECRNEDTEVKKILSTLHSPLSEKSVQKERAQLKKYGGGCHQRFGSTLLSVGSNDWLRTYGATESGIPLDEYDGIEKPDVTHPWISNSQCFKKEIFPISIETNSVFLCHSQTLKSFTHPPKHLWTAGTKTWFAAAKKGFWVEGCADGFGMSHLSFLRNASWTKVPPIIEWEILTHESAVSSWDHPQVKSTYRLIPLEIDSQSINSLKKYDGIYWQSSEHYTHLKDYISTECKHFCGPGKTKDELLKMGIVAKIYPSPQIWKNIINT